VPNTDLNPTGPAQGTSYIYKYGTTPNTRSVVSQKVRILAPAYGGGKQLFQIGVLGSVNPSESRTVEPVSSIGFGDIIAEMVPGKTEAMKVSTERTLLYLSNLWQSTGYAGGVSGPVRSLRHHRWPFDVMQQIVFSVIADKEVGAPDTTAQLDYAQSWGGEGGSLVGGSHRILITMFEACWWEQWSAQVQKDQALVSESGDFSATDVHDFSSIYGEFMATGNDPSNNQYGSIQYGNLFGLNNNVLNAVGNNPAAQ
jgi:hypothetical protein